MWRVKAIRSNSYLTEEFVTAASIEDVWEYLAPDRADGDTEIESIGREVAVVRQL